MMSTDQNFKNVIVDYTGQSAEVCAASEFALLPPGVVFTPIRQEQLKENLDDSFKELDVPIEVTFPDGTTEALIFVFENESTNRANFLHYLAIVSLRISMMMKTRRVVPVAVHMKRTTPLVTELTLGGQARNYLEFNCLSCVIGTMDARQHLDSKNIVARLLLPLMKYAPEDKLLVVTRSFEGLVELEKEPSLRTKYAGFISHYSGLLLEEKQEFYDKYVNHSPYKEEIMTLYRILHDEGEAVGMVKGELNHARKTVLRHGTRRFGSPDAQTLTALNSIQGLERLDDLVDRMMLVSTWSELLK